MNISELSIRRPVLSTVMTLIILLFGFIGYNSLGVREYPSVDKMSSRIRSPNRWSRTSMVFQAFVPCQVSVAKDPAVLQ